MARLANTVLFWVQVGLAAVKLVVRQRPPLTLPTNTVLPLTSDWSTRMALQRPPILFGPLSVHVSPPPVPPNKTGLPPPVPSVMTPRLPEPPERSSGCLLRNSLYSISL